MRSEQKIKRAFERNAKAMALRPSIARGTAVTRVRLTGGLTCEIEDGPWKLTADLPEKGGGDRTREEAHAEYLASIDAYRDGEGYSMPGEFVIATAVCPS